MVNKVPWFSLAAICWLVALLAGTLLPSDKIPEVTTRMSDKVIHGLIFFILATLFLIAARKERFLRIPPDKIYIIIIPLILLVAIMTEGLQYFIPGRMSDLNDLIANIAGVLLGVLVYRLIFPKIGRNNQQQ